MILRVFLEGTQHLQVTPSQKLVLSVSSYIV